MDVIKKNQQHLPSKGNCLKFLNQQIHNIYVINQLILSNFFQQIRIIQFHKKVSFSKW
jgi:hypothetical protein